MQQKALQYYHQGWNCSQCILKAAEQEYRIPVSKQSLALCNGINTGFGMGGFCALLIAGIMVFGLLFDEATAKSLRLQFLMEVKDKYGSHNCCDLIKMRNENSNNCEALVSSIAEVIDKLVKQKYS